MKSITVKVDKGKNLQIEGLRGIAILLVVFYHTFCRYQQIFMNEYINSLSVDNWGHYGVSIFLVITGCYILGRKQRYSWLNGLNFLLRKLLRLWPIYAISITITFTVLSVFNLSGRMCTIRDYILNLFFINGFIGTSYVDSAHWYLTALIGVYISIALIKMIGKEGELWFYDLWMFIVAVLLFGHVNITNVVIQKVFYGLASLLGEKYISLIIFGILLRELYEKKIRITPMFLVTVFLATVYHVYFWSYLGVTSVIELVVAVSLVSLSLWKKLNFLEIPVLEILGNASYCIFLIHQNIAYKFEETLSSLCGGFSYGFAFATAIGVILIGIFLYYFCEKPIQNKLGDMMKRRR